MLITYRLELVIQTSKTLTSADRDRLGSKAAAIMPKSGNRADALRLIREILNEFTLFADEPEFTGHEAHA